MNCQQHKISLGALALLALLALAGAKAEQQDERLAARRLEGDGLGGRLAAAARFRRQAHPHKLTVGQLAALSNQAEQVEQTLAEADEQTLKRQLPDLIAQAHNDKALERALLRLVISASLRNANLIREQQQQQQQQLGAATGQWQLDNQDNAQNNLAQYNQANSGSVGEFAPIRLASGRLESGELANLEAQLVAAELPELANLNGGANGGGGGIAMSSSSSAPMDKREYSKPCLFNAISCVRTPFRKLTS